MNGNHNTNVIEFDSEELAFLGLPEKASLAHVHTAWLFRVRAMGNVADKTTPSFIANYQRLVTIGCRLKRLLSA